MACCLYKTIKTGIASRHLALSASAALAGCTVTATFQTLLMSYTATKWPKHAKTA
jgi:hypothetical protein